MENNEKQTKSEQDCGSDWISFLNFAAKIQNIKVMKRISFYSHTVHKETVETFTGSSI